MTYVPPEAEMLFVLKKLCGLDEIRRLQQFKEFGSDVVAAIVEEAGKFAANSLSPLNREGDVSGAQWKEGRVKTPPGWLEAYTSFCENGWTAPTASPDHGGMGLPNLLNACVQEMFHGANMAFQLCPMLTQGAIEALDHYGSETLKKAYLSKLVTGEWSGTMNLTEAQAGSDLSLIRSRAVPEDDHFLISGQKIFITYGEHDLTDNIVHLVLARLPDSPVGVKGISLFLVPKKLEDGRQNDVRCISIEHKLGIHGSPTCTLSFGDEGGAIGYLIGEPNHGLECMFAMMNNARLNVGLQGIGVAEHALQDAVRYAALRRQGHAKDEESPAAIVSHPDVLRMLGLMQARTRAARILAYRAASSLDFAFAADDERIRRMHRRRVDLLIPVVKGWSTDLSINTTSMGLQVHGGMGYVEETGVAQHYRDARIASIYEGTTGIQAMDLVMRKIRRDDGWSVAELVADIRQSSSALEARNDTAADWQLLARAVNSAADLITQTTDWLLDATEPELALAAAGNVLEVFGVGLGMWCMGDAAFASSEENNAEAAARLRLAEFYTLQVFPEAAARSEALLYGSKAVLGLDVVA